MFEFHHHTPTISSAFNADTLLLTSGIEICICPILTKKKVLNEKGVDIEYIHL